MTQTTKGMILAELTLEVVRLKYLCYEPKFILHTKDEDEYFHSIGKSWKGMNRMIRKIIGRKEP